jgi:hypothetical protein
MATLTGILESLSGGSGVARRLDAGEILFTTGDSVRGASSSSRGASSGCCVHTSHGAAPM